MRRAQAICRRLRKRDIYAFAKEVTIPPRYDDDWEEPSAAGAQSLTVPTGCRPVLIPLELKFRNSEA